MSAHDSSTEAHVSSPPPGGRPPTSINVDQTGISMSWRTAVTVIGFLGFVMLSWSTFATSLLRATDLVDHNVNSTAHAKHPAHADLIKRAEVVEMVQPIRTQGEKTARVVSEIQNGIYEQRADDLAYRAIEQLPKGAGPRRISKHFDGVKKQALANQKAGRDILDGIDAPVM